MCIGSSLHKKNDVTRQVTFFMVSYFFIQRAPFSLWPEFQNISWKLRGLLKKATLAQTKGQMLLPLVLQLIYPFHVCTYQFQVYCLPCPQRGLLLLLNRIYFTILLLNEQFLLEPRICCCKQQDTFSFRIPSHLGKVRSNCLDSNLLLTIADTSKAPWHTQPPSL